MAVRIGFLHTSELHVGTFTDLLADVAPGATGVHVVDEALLDDARAHGTDDAAVRERVGSRLGQVADGADAVLCTCSTLGALAELLAPALDVPVVRVDRPMAAAAVRSGERIGIVAAVESTVGPTRVLLEEEAARQHRRVTLVDLPCTEAWAAFEAGDVERYLAQIAEHVDRVASTVDVVVLAQASMAPAAARCSTSTPVLASPRAGVEAAVAAAG